MQNVKLLGMQNTEETFGAKVAAWDIVRHLLTIIEICSTKWELCSGKCIYMLSHSMLCAMIMNNEVRFQPAHAVVQCAKFNLRSC